MMTIFKNLFLLSAFSFGFAIFLYTGFLIVKSYAEYDCSAKDDGWYYDPEFCHVYWRCIHGTSEEFECASGTAWDHHENRCNWIDSVDCSRSEKTTAKTISEDEDDDPDQNIVEGNHNDNNDDDDDQPKVIVKKVKKKKKKHRKIDAKKKMLDGENNEDLLILIISQTNSSNDFLCAGRDGFFSDPEYCTRYYRCSHGMDEMFECPRGTAWDEITKSCAWVDQVNCDQKKLGYSTSTTTEDTTTISNKKSNTESIVTEATLAPGTNGKDSNDGSSMIECQPTGIYAIPDPTECNVYHQCDKGIRTKMTCPERQLYDTEKHECNEYERVFCGTRVVNPSDKNQCVNKRDGIHPDVERDCRHYYQCIGQNKLREAKCTGDQKFSTYTGRCGPASNAPAPCGTFVPGNTATKNHRAMGFIMQIALIMILIISF